MNRWKANEQMHRARCGGRAGAPKTLQVPTLPNLHEFNSEALQATSFWVVMEVSSSHLQTFPASGSFPMSQLFTSGGQRIGASALASVLPLNIQGWFPLGLTALISLQPWVSEWVSEVAQSCRTLCNPMDCSPPGSSNHGILQAVILERVAMPSFRVYYPPRDWTCVSYVFYIGGQIFFLFFFFFNHWATREAQMRGLSWPCSWQHGGDFLGKSIQISFSLRSWKREVTSIAGGWVGQKASIMTGEEAWIWQK